MNKNINILFIFALFGSFFLGRISGKKVNPPIQKGFIYQQEPKEDSTYELIVLPSKDWTIVHK